MCSCTTVTGTPPQQLSAAEVETQNISLRHHALISRHQSISNSQLCKMLGSMLQVVVQKASNKVVGVIIAFLHTARHI